MPAATYGGVLDHNSTYNQFNAYSLDKTLTTAATINGNKTKATVPYTYTQSGHTTSGTATKTVQGESAQVSSTNGSLVNYTVNSNTKTASGTCQHSSSKWALNSSGLYTPSGAPSGFIFSYSGSTSGKVQCNFSLPAALEVGDGISNVVDPYAFFGTAFDGAGLFLVVVGLGPIGWGVGAIGFGIGLWGLLTQ